MAIPTSNLALLRLLHLADSALPVGGAAHSFGLETLTENGYVSAENLPEFLSDWLFENGAVEVTACRIAHRLAQRFEAEAWNELNERLSAMKMSRETRLASMALGKRLLILVKEIHPAEVFPGNILDIVAQGKPHYSTVFGLSASLLGLDEDDTGLALLHQSAANLVYASQRLLPVGQVYATQLLWSLKSVIADVAARQSTVTQLAEVCCFAPSLEAAAMRHPYIATRLFIS